MIYYTVDIHQCHICDGRTHPHTHIAAVLLCAVWLKLILFIF